MSLTQFLNPDGINRTTVSATDPLPVTGTFEAPVGGATEAKQDTSITHLAAIETATETLAAVDFSAGTAGSPAGGVSSVQGVTGMVPLSVYVRASEYETVAASQTDQMMGPTGAVGDTIEGILVIPATTSPGAVSIEDGSTNTTVFTGGASSVTNLIPFYIPLNNIASVSGGWEITTGANVSCIVFGNFT
jgi:hypothetical protein